ncbi:MAG: hypothetical protein GXP42_18440 [Chloroflexi bacterium]|nr:hypothetical protein [Chloroflexota bacterium]
MTDPATRDLETNLRFHMAWVSIVRTYLRKQPKPDVAHFLERMLETEQQAVDMLARELRRLGVAASRLPPQDDLVADGLRRKNARSRLQFIHVGLTRSLEWYRQRLADEKNPHHELWQALNDLQSPLAVAAKALLQEITHG